MPNEDGFEEVDEFLKRAGYSEAEALRVKVKIARRSQMDRIIRGVLSIVGGFVGFWVSFRVLYWGVSVPVFWSMLVAVVIGGASSIGTFDLALKVQLRITTWQRDFKWRQADRAIAKRTGAPPPWPSELQFFWSFIRPGLVIFIGIFGAGLIGGDLLILYLRQGWGPGRDITPAIVWNLVLGAAFVGLWWRLRKPDAAGRLRLPNFPRLQVPGVGAVAGWLREGASSLRLRVTRPTPTGDLFAGVGGAAQSPNLGVGHGGKAVAGLAIVAASFWANGHFDVEGWPQWGLALVGLLGAGLFLQSIEEKWKGRKNPVFIGLGLLIAAGPWIVSLHDHRMPHDTEWVLVGVAALIGFGILRRGLK